MLTHLTSNQSVVLHFAVESKFLWIGASLWEDGDKIRRTWKVRRHQKEAPHLRGRGMSLRSYRLPCALLRLAKTASR